jgi:hypothetical protein
VTQPLEDTLKVPVKLWIDTKTNLPAKLESRFNIGGSKIQLTQTFTINGRLDENLFVSPAEQEQETRLHGVVDLFDKDGAEAVKLISGVELIKAYRWQGGPLTGYLVLAGGKEPKRLDLREETLKEALGLWKEKVQDRLKTEKEFDAARVGGKLIFVRRPSRTEKGAKELVLIMEVNYETWHSAFFASTSKEYGVTAPPGKGQPGFTRRSEGENGETREELFWDAPRPNRPAQEVFWEIRGVAKPESKKK